VGEAKQFGEVGKCLATCVTEPDDAPSLIYKENVKVRRWIFVKSPPPRALS